MFDRYLADQQPNWKRRWLSIASLVLHGAVGAGVIGYTFFHVEEITPPALSLTFFNSAPPPPPPPPPPAGGNSSPQTPKIKKVEIKPDLSKLIQPTEVKPVEEKPKETQKDDSNEKGEDGGEKGGVVGGEKGGVAGGEVGGKVGGQLGGTGTGTGGNGGKNVAQFVLAASRLDAPNPTTPDWFYNEYRGRSARGTYRLCVGTDGRVVSMETLGALPGDMNSHVIEHVKSKWKFKPQPFTVCAQWVFDFQPK